MRCLWMAAALAGLSVAACSRQDGAAFADAKKAVAAQRGNPPGLVFEDLQMHHASGLKGSKADVVCGDVAPDDKTAATHFIYFAKLQAAGPDIGRTVGETQVFDTVDRRAGHELNFFCTPHPDLTDANAYDYFN